MLIGENGYQKGKVTCIVLRSKPPNVSLKLFPKHLLD